ncbi:MAG: permease-like cell division protein FtsX, partial [Firmicutes bacterium]|nr:permease-like cell division protein FtsX [Bacillota bacterium]
MRLRTMANCVKDGFRGILRNGLMSLASIGTITACLMILGLTYCVVVNVQSFASGLDGNLGMVAFLEAGVTEEDVQQLINKLDAREDVKDYKYVSADEAWEEFKQEMLGGDELTEELMGELDSDNPLENSANIEIFPRQSEDQQAIVDFLENEPTVRKINYSANASRALASLGNLVTYVGMALMAFLIFVALLLIANTIKLSLYIRRHEI